VGNGPVFNGKTAEIRLIKVNAVAGVVEVVFAGDSLRTRGKDASAGCAGGGREKRNH
jgi:hypothetical protein